MNTNRLDIPRMTSARKTTRAVGILYLITHLTSIIAGLVYRPILSDPAAAILSVPDLPVLVAAYLEVILGIAIVGTGAVLYPFLKRQNEGVALTYLGLRIFEAILIAVGILPLLVLITLPQQLVGGADAGAAAMLPLGQSLASFHNWTALFATNLIYGTHTVLLAYLLYQTRLVPRFIPVLCLIGGPAVFILGTVKMFGLIPADSLWELFGALPAFAWEVSLATWLIAKGFNRWGAVANPAAAANEGLSAA